MGITWSQESVGRIKPRKLTLEFMSDESTKTMIIPIEYNEEKINYATNPTSNTPARSISLTI